MNKFNLRQKPRVSYCEYEEPNLDEYVYCDKCTDFVYEYCSIHGPLLVIPDDKVPFKTGLPSFVPRAALTIPHHFLHLAPSVIPGAGLGVFSTLTLPRGVRFGPYRGKVVDNIDSMYGWQLHDGNNKWCSVIDAADPTTSNWMRYVNCARHFSEQNLIAYQFQGQIYYRTIRIIPRFTELMVFYGAEFAQLLGIGLRLYNQPSGFAQTLCHATSPKVIEETVKQTPTKLAATDHVETRLESNKNDNSSNMLHIRTKKMKKKFCPPIDKKSQIIRGPGNDLNKNSKQSKTNINPLITLPKDNHFICDQCKKIFKSKSSLKRHIKVHDIKSGKFKKQTLVIEKNRSSTLRIVEKTIYPEMQSDVKRDDCDFGPMSNEVRSDKIYQPPIESVRSTSLSKHTNMKRHKCDICGKAFTQASCLKTHSLIHAGIKPHKCDICGKAFTQAINLKTHTLIHAAIKPHKCDICGKAFTQASYLKTHSLIHAGIKPHKCDICGKAFTQAINLKTHTLIHAAIKPHKCDICGKAFTQASKLKRHSLIHAGIKPHKCDICGKAFTQAFNLKTHTLNHAGIKPHKCDICGKAFTPGE